MYRGLEIDCYLSNVTQDRLLTVNTLLSVIAACLFQLDSLVTTFGCDCELFSVDCSIEWHVLWLLGYVWFLLTVHQTAAINHSEQPQSERQCEMVRPANSDRAELVRVFVLTTWRSVPAV